MKGIESIFGFNLSYSTFNLILFDREPEYIRKIKQGVVFYVRPKKGRTPFVKTPLFNRQICSLRIEEGCLR